MLLSEKPAMITNPQATEFTPDGRLVSRSVTDAFNKKFNNSQNPKTLHEELNIRNTSGMSKLSLHAKKSMQQQVQKLQRGIQQLREVNPQDVTAPYGEGVKINNLPKLAS